LLVIVEEITQVAHTTFLFVLFL